MDYERKYKNALGWMQSLYDGLHGATKEDAEHYFPELKESEDERIRKGIIKYLGWIKDRDGSYMPNNIPFEDMIAWLEKKAIIEMKSPEESLGIDSDTYNNIVDECIYGEQKPADMVEPKDYSSIDPHFFKSTDKVEPKFHEGDFIKHNRVSIICKVISVNSSSYYVENIKTNGRIELFNAEQNFHLWTIQDAKDGDVLVSKDKEDILIYKSYSVIDLLLTSYISFSKKEGFCPRQYSAWDSNEFIPATKEQRDLLFQKMEDAGYELDADKKELKKKSQRMISAEAKEALYDKPTRKPDYSGLTEFERAIHRGFLCAGVENVSPTIIKETAQDCLAELSKQRIGE